VGLGDQAVKEAGRDTPQLPDDALGDGAELGEGEVRKGGRQEPLQLLLVVAAVDALWFGGGWVGGRGGGGMGIGEVIGKTVVGLVWSGPSIQAPPPPSLVTDRPHPMHAPSSLARRSTKMLRYTCTRGTPSMSSICSAGPASATAAKPFLCWNSRVKTRGSCRRSARLMSALVPAVPTGGPCCRATESFSTAPPPGVGVGVPAAPRRLLLPPAAGAAPAAAAAAAEGVEGGGPACADAVAAAAGAVGGGWEGVEGCCCCCCLAVPVSPAAAAAAAAVAAVGVGTLIFSGADASADKEDADAGAGGGAGAGAVAETEEEEEEGGSVSLSLVVGASAIAPAAAAAAEEEEEEEGSTTLSFLAAAAPASGPSCCLPSPAALVAATSSSSGAARLRDPLAAIVGSPPSPPPSPAAAAAAPALGVGTTARRIRGLACGCLSLSPAPFPSTGGGVAGSIARQSSAPAACGLLVVVVCGGEPKSIESRTKKGNHACRQQAHSLSPATRGGLRAMMLRIRDWLVVALIFYEAQTKPRHIKHRSPSNGPRSAPSFLPGLLLPAPPLLPTGRSGRLQSIVDSIDIPSSSLDGARAQEDQAHGGAGVAQGQEDARQGQQQAARRQERE
jgi:hypothetical protein